MRHLSVRTRVAAAVAVLIVVLIVILVPVLTTVHRSHSASRQRNLNPQVTISQGTVHGLVDTNYGLDQFLGIPYAKPPLDQLRFARPQPLNASSNSTIDATRFGDICMQPGAPSPLYNMSENCLNLNVIRPNGTQANAKLPVLAWIYGGAFLTGSTPIYNASELVQKSVDIGNPILFVALSYRVGPFGFIGGSEIADSDSATPNAGLYDQRLALQWVHDNIANFGGDPNQVTIFGQSAGAMSVALNNFANNGNNNNLWQAAIMNSGGIVPGALLTPQHPTVQKSFQALAAGVGCGRNDNVTLAECIQTAGIACSLSSERPLADCVKDASVGCSKSNNGPLLECLRGANAADVMDVGVALDSQGGGTTPIAGALAWLPLVDSELITDYPSVNLPSKLADIPVITGNVLDEGPLFAQKALNSSAAFETWVSSATVIYNTSDTQAALSQVYQLYPDIPAQGSPYYNPETNTSALTNYNDSRILPPLDSNQFRRSAAFFGDYAFQAHRRVYLNAATSSGKQNARNVWSFEFQQNDKFANGTGSPLGAYHGSELKYLFVQPDGRAKDPVLEDKIPRAYISFVYYHDPTRLSGLDWPRYSDGGELLQLKGGNVTRIPDTYRKEAMESLTNAQAAKVFGM